MLDLCRSLKRWPVLVATLLLWTVTLWLFDRGGHVGVLIAAVWVQVMLVTWGTAPRRR